MGDLTGGGTNWANPGMAKEMQNLETTDAWKQRWTDILKMGAVQPKPEHAVFATARVNGVELSRQPFVVQQGLNPADFMKDEAKIATTLSAAPFVSVTGFMLRGTEHRLGADRHPQAFSITWASKPVPAKPDVLSTGTG